MCPGQEFSAGCQQKPVGLLLVSVESPVTSSLNARGSLFTPVARETPAGGPGFGQLQLTSPCFFLEMFVNPCKSNNPWSLSLREQPGRFCREHLLGVVQRTYISSRIGAGGNPGAGFPLEKAETHLHTVYTGAAHIWFGKKVNNSEKTSLKGCLEGELVIKRKKIKPTPLLLQ